MRRGSGPYTPTRLRSIGGRSFGIVISLMAVAGCGPSPHAGPMPPDFRVGRTVTMPTLGSVTWETRVEIDANGRGTMRVVQPFHADGREASPGDDLEAVRWDTTRQEFAVSAEALDSLWNDVSGWDLSDTPPRDGDRVVLGGTLTELRIEGNGQILRLDDASAGKWASRVSRLKDMIARVVPEPTAAQPLTARH